MGCTMGTEAKAPGHKLPTAATGPQATAGIVPVEEGSDEDIAGRFALLDLERTGFLDRKAVANLVQQLRLAASPHVKHTEFDSVRVTEKDVDDAMAVLDTNQDGLVDYDEFSTWWKSTGGCL